MSLSTPLRIAIIATVAVASLIATNSATAAESDLVAPAHTSTVANAQASRLIDDYVNLHNRPTREGIATVFTPDFVVVGTTIPKGVTGDDYFQFLKEMEGATFSQSSGTQVLVAADGRLVLFWTLRRGSTQLARGVDYVTVEGGKIKKIVGIY
jgi:hypothetical protein